MRLSSHVGQPQTADRIIGKEISPDLIGHLRGQAAGAHLLA
jgi:hypothetical protein